MGKFSASQNLDYLLTGLETGRLVFDLNSREGYSDWLPFFRDPEAVRFVGLGSYGSPEAACDAWFEKAEDRMQRKAGGMNVLREKGTGTYIGQCGLLVQEVDGEEILEIGYSLLPDFRGKGYATEAAQMCRDLAFQNKWSDRLYSIIHVDNVASAAVARKNGMYILKRTDFWGMPVNLFIIDRDDWIQL